MWPLLSRYFIKRSIFSFASSICSEAPLNFICVPRLKIFRRGNFFFRMSSLPLLTPKNSIGFTFSKLMMVSVNFYLLCLSDYSLKNFSNTFNSNLTNSCGYIPIKIIHIIKKICEKIFRIFQRFLNLLTLVLIGLEVHKPCLKNLLSIEKRWYFLC